MISESLARRYAAALYHLAVDRNILDTVRDEFKLIDRLVKSSKRIRYFLYSPKVDREEKKRILQSILSDHVSSVMLHFLFLLLDKKRQTMIEKMFSHFMRLYDNHYNRAIISVRPAVKLDAAILDEIKRGFEKRLDKTITVEEEVVPSLIGGLQVRVNNMVYDASVKAKLEHMRKHLIAQI